jgi:hypothetical protein
MMAYNREPHYLDGTAAGFKGNSAVARQNSREAAPEVTQSLGRRQRQVLHAWERYGPAGAIPEQIAADLDLALHCVRPRAGELVKLGRLYEVGRRPGGMGCNVTAYSVVKPLAIAEAA